MKKLLVFLLFAAAVFAETQGTINFTYYNATTGLYGYSVKYCNATSECANYGCYRDFYTNTDRASAGWCNQTGITSCYHDNIAYSSGTYVCGSGNVTYYQCGSGGVWSNATTCSSGACVGGSTACSSSSGSGSGSGQGTITVDLTPSIMFSSIPESFDITQGQSSDKTLKVKNNGNQTLYNVTVSVAGVSWYIIVPQKLAHLSRNGEAQFNMTFTAPENAEVKTYVLTFVVNSHNASLTTSSSLAVKASETTAQEVIVPDYQKYVTLLEELRTNTTSLKNAGANVDDIENLLLNAQTKLNQVGIAIDSKDYSTAVQYMDDARGLLSAASAKIAATERPPFLSPTLIVVIIIVIIAAAAVLYLALPPKQNSRRMSDYFGRRR